MHTFLTTQERGGPPRMSDQPYAGATSETAQTRKTIHTKHTLSHPNKANMEWWSRRPNDIRGPWGRKFPDICFTGDENPEKNLTQETCPDWGSKPGSLRDKRACDHLLHSGGLFKNHFKYQFWKLVNNLLLPRRAISTHGPTWAMAKGGRQFFRTRIFIVPFHDLSIHAYETSF